MEGQARVLEFLKWALILAAIVYVLIFAALYVFQRRILFLVQPSRVSPVEAGVTEAEEHVLKTEDGERIVTWLRRPLGAQRPLFVMFVGNGDSLAGLASALRRLSADGSGYLAVAYRGYSGSTGSPSEAGIALDALTAYGFAASMIAPRQIVLLGYSLGSAVAISLGARKSVAGVILLAPFTSAADVAAQIYPIFPVRWLMKDQFRAVEEVHNLRAPVLVLHGEHDTVVPIEFGRKLYAAAIEPKRFVALPKADHFSILDRGGMEAIRAFLDEFGLR